MRVVSGFARGHKLICPEGDSVRPTSDRVKEAVFSTLGLGVQDSHFLDMFSGSGAIGIEAMSRGAAHTVFVEECLAHADIIKRNLAHVSKAIPEGSYKLFRENALDALRILKSLNLCFDIIFLDPPYKTGLWEPVLRDIYEMKLLSASGIIVLEMGKDEKEPDLFHFNIIKRKVYGTTVVYYIK